MPPPPISSSPRIVFAAANSDSGKTTLALGTIAALRRRGLAVAAAKTGPDFIDAAHLARASGRPARNLDAYLSPESLVACSFARGADRADVTVVEGAMGLFDGRHGSGCGSTAHVARILGAPVVLVLDCAKSSTTIGAIAYGLARFDPRLTIAGAILNRVASDKHAATVRDACVAAGVRVLGVVRRDDALHLGSRHLGLVAPEGDAWQAALDAAERVVTRDVDLDALLAAARAVEPLPVPHDHPQFLGRAGDDVARVRVALARDEAFWFYDEASLDALRDRGVDLVPYAPLHDPFPAHVAAAFVGGGYPEVHAAGLEANVVARDGLARAIATGMPAYAECGGLMYLSEALETADGAHAMTGAVPATSTMSAKRSALRYVDAGVLADGPMFARGDVVRGHEYHYSQTRYRDGARAFAFEGEREGFVSPNVHASYVHVHLGAHGAAVDRFVARARAFAGVR
ncbi:MAG: cobyrinate a,c-diamide synthase [Vulcanimicrobiaceae bacterium]